MYQVKIMSSEDIPDSDSRKGFHLISGVKSVMPMRGEDGRAFVSLHYPDGSGEHVEIQGNAYIMNENGKTIAAFGCAPYHNAHDIKTGETFTPQRHGAGMKASADLDKRGVFCGKPAEVTA